MCDCWWILHTLTCLSLYIIQINHTNKVQDYNYVEKFDDLIVHCITCKWPSILVILPVFNLCSQFPLNPLHIENKLDITVFFLEHLTCESIWLQCHPHEHDSSHRTLHPQRHFIWSVLWVAWRWWQASALPVVTNSTWLLELSHLE